MFAVMMLGPLLQAAGDVLAWPLIVAVLALLAISGVASAITAGFLKLPTSIKPEAVVYIVCAVIVTIGYFMAGGKLPLVDPADPAGTVAAWTVMVGALGKFTQTFYDVVLRRLWPAPAPA